LVFDQQGNEIACTNGLLLVYNSITVLKTRGYLFYLLFFALR
jgi:hypothetical protein